MHNRVKMFNVGNLAIILATGLLVSACGDAGSTTSTTTGGMGASGGEGGKGGAGGGGLGGMGGMGGGGGAGCSGPGEQTCNELCTDTQSDPANCGACGNDCANLPNVDASTVTCNAGVCVIVSCAAAYADCDKEIKNGCETNTTTSDNCGACAAPCVQPTPLCAADPSNGQYSCVNACPEGTPTACGTSCVDLQTNILHCGKCDNACLDVANGQPTCDTGMCGFTCNSGFMNNGTSCVDIDECATNADDCDPNATCVNTPGSFGCLCNAGYAGNGRTCTDVDECALNTDNCDPNATCANTTGSFTCTCGSGYIGNGSFCADVNECADGTDNCDPNAACTNTPGSFTCACNPGFTGNGVMCTDIDECALNTDNCDVNAACTNTPGSFTCSCNAGYSGNGLTCSDVDECATNTDNCDQNATCANTTGSFNCTCNPGYSGNGVTCTDINECALNTDNCDANATCTNTPGSFDCNCNMGYLGNGVMCTDIDECATGMNNCMTPTTCVNTPGSYICDCLAPNALCNGVCKNLDNDSMNCGMCGMACTTNQQCVNGTCVGTGNLQITLTWNVSADLDLHLITPSGKHIYYSNKGPSLATDFGQLDVDDIGGTGPENIFWATANTPPNGTYLVCVSPYSVTQATTYSLTIKRPGLPDINLSGTRSVSNTNSNCDMASPNFVTSFTFP